MRNHTDPMLDPKLLLRALDELLARHGLTRAVVLRRARRQDATQADRLLAVYCRLVVLATQC